MREGRRLKRLRAMPAAEAWAALRDGGEPEQVATWLEIFRRSFDEPRYLLARDTADRAVSALAGQSVEAWLLSRGIVVEASSAPSTFGTATVRAWLDLTAGRVTVFESSLATLTRAFETCASAVDSAVLRDAIVAHEAFHALHPDCPDNVAEMTAHLFAGRLTGLGFAGLLDVVHVVARSW